MASNRKLLLLCAFVVSAVAVPVANIEKCARRCTEEGDFLLNPESTYTYDYETTTTTAVLGSTQDVTKIQLTSQVDIEVISKCDLSLRLRGVTLKVSDPESPEFLNAIRGARDFARSLEKHILRFSFQNGKVEHVCPTETVPIWVTNIQKGVLSAFQTHMIQPDWSAKTEEIDVLGKCEAEYQSLGTSWQGTHTIRKLKDLSTCTERENVDTYLQGTPYMQDFQQKKSAPLVKGNQECEQVISQGFLQSSTCREKLVFRPFSNGGSSVITSVVQKLSYSAISKRSFTGNDYRPTIETLLYRHAKAEENPSRSEADAEEALRNLCAATEQDVSITVPRLFSAFVYKLKKLSLTTLKNFHQKNDKICTKARKFFMDAIPIVATTDSAKFMYEMISRNAISESEISFWLTSLSFVNEPTPDIIAAFTPLLDGRHEQALLGVSALMHTFCKSNDCSQVTEVRNAVYKLFGNLGENCYTSEDKKTILTLKALSNVGVMFGRENILQACAKNPQVRMETRLAAIQAFRRVSCDISRESLMQMYSNYNEDPEIRIAAYLAVMSCPTTDVVDSVKDVLMHEKINHVGSFIWTHLNALSRSKHPQRQDIRDIVSNLYLLNKYNSDARKFSTAREATFYLEAIDSGFHIDNHLIFSTDSYLPRTAMFNLTVDIFGKTCNLFQIDGRMEGLEHVVESFFGPSGYFPQKNIAKMLREKRSISSNKIQDMDEKFQAKSRFQQDPYGSVDVKIFGTTLWYNQFREDPNTPDINLIDLVTKLAEEHEAEYSRSFMFLDTTFTVPMTSGMPMRIAVNGTASIALKYGGKFDVKSFEHVDVLGHIEPSGAIEIASLLTVDAGNVARSGLRVVGTMHSSTVLDGRLEVRNGEVVKAKLNMPRDRIDIFNVQTKMYLVHGMEEREQKTDKKAKTELKSCTGSTTSKLFGIQLCSELRLPPYKPNSALHPVNGPASYNLYIQKTDPTLKSYTFDAEYKLEMKNGALVRHALLSMNTPDSQVDRDVKLEGYINHAEHTATLKIKTPVKRFGGTAKLVNEDALKKLMFEVTIDDKEYFAMLSELKIIADRNSVTYMPTLEIRIPSRRLAAFSGSAYINHGEKYTVQLQVEDLTEKPILAKGNLQVSRQDRYDGELTINSFALDGTVKGYAQFGNNMASRITAEYKFLEGKMNKINIMGKMRNLSANSLMKYTGLLNVQASLLPEWNTELSFETMSTTGHIENTISLSLGDGVRSRVHSIRLQEILRYEGSLKNNKLDGSLSLVYPERNIDYAIQVNHENTETSLKNIFTVQYDSRQKVMTEVKLNVNQNAPFAVVGDMKVKYPGRDAVVSASLLEINPDEYTATMTCQWQEGKRASFMVNYKDKTDSSRIKYEVEGAVELPLRGPITFSSTIGAQGGSYVGITEVNMGMDKYRVKLDYTMGKGIYHKVSGQVLLNTDVYGLEAAVQQVKSKLSSNLEIKMPNRHRIISQLEARSGDFMQSGSFDISWDADRDTSKRFGIGGEIRSHDDGYEARMTMQIRRRTITGLLNTSMKGQFLSSQWTTNNKIEVQFSPSEKASITFTSNALLGTSRQQLNSQLDILTSYYGYENMSVSLTHMYANQQWESELSTMLPMKNQIVVSSSGKYSFTRAAATLETRAKLQSTFSQIGDKSFELYHDHSSKELTSKIQLGLGSGKSIGLDVSGEANPSMYRGSLKFSSSFKNFEQLSAEIVHKQEGNPVNSIIQTRCEFQWAPRRKVSLNFEGKHVLSGGRRRICTVVLTGSSPFQDFENPVAKISYSNDGNTLNNDIELTWSNRNKITVGFSASQRNSPYVQTIESKLQITTPFRNYNNIQISSSVETNRNTYKCNIDAHLPYRSTASLNSQGKFSSVIDMEFNTVVIYHFPKLSAPQRVSVDFVHKLQSSKLRSSLDAALNNDHLTLLFVGLTDFRHNSRQIEFSTSLNTPISGYEEIKCDFAHSMKGYEYVTKIQANKNKMTGTLTHKLSSRDMLNFETTLEVTSTEMQDTKFSIIQMQNEGQLEHSSTLTWGRNKRIHLNALYAIKTSMKEISLKLTTPFQNYRELEAKTSYERQNWDHRASLSVSLDRKHKAAVSGNLRNFKWQNLNTELEFTSSLSGFEFYSASVKYDLTAPVKTLEMSYLWNANNRKAITLKGKFIYSYSLTNIDLVVTTPFKNFNQVTLVSKLENSPPETNLNIRVERGSKRITFNGKTIINKNRAHVTFDLYTPYQIINDLKFDAKYNILSEGMNGEISTEWNRAYTYRLKGEYKLANSAAEGKIFVVTPFEGYRIMDLQSNINYGGYKKAGEVSIKWENDNSALLSGEYTTRRDGRKITMDLQTPNGKYEISSWYKASSGAYDAEVKVNVNNDRIYEGDVAVKLGREKPLDIKLNINLPGTRINSLQFTTIVASESGYHQISSTLLCNGKESTFSTIIKQMGNQFFELNTKLNTPYENFRLFSLEITYRQDYSKFMDYRLKMVSPFEILRSLDTYLEVKIDDSGVSTEFSYSTPKQKFTLEGKVSNRQFHPFTAVFEIDAPSMSFRKLSAKADVDIIEWNNAKMTFLLSAPKFRHEITTAFVQENENYDFEMKVQSSALSAQPIVLTANAKYEDMTNVESEATLQLLGKTHNFNLKLTNTGKATEVQVKLGTPLLPENKAELQATLSKKRRNSNRIFDGKLTLSVPSSTHEISAKYEGKNNQIATNLRIDSNLLKSSPVEAQAKYTNGNDKDFEAAITVSTPSRSHKVVGSLKNYENDKFVQLKIECPMVEMLRAFSVTGTLKHEGFESMDGSISIGSIGKEVRIAGNMKNEGLKNIEAFITLNTPFDTLPMLRVDGRFKNDRLQNIDCNFQVETTNSNLGMTSKIIRTKGSEEISLMLHLPLRNYRTVQVLANAHYNGDYSTADSRITLTIPPTRYSISGQYEIRDPRMSGTIELELNNKKWATSGRFESTQTENSASLSFTNPSSRRYNVGGSYGNSDAKHYVAGWYYNPDEEKYGANTSLRFTDLTNFETTAVIETPFASYRSIEASINQQYNSNYLSTTVDYAKNGRRGFLKVLQRNTRNSLIGSVQMGCPYAKLRDVKLTYNHQKKSREQECNVELHLNREKQFKAELLQFGVASSHVILDVPVLAMTLTADSKSLTHGREYNIKSNYMSRVMGFKTSYQRGNKQLLHDAQFTWDEKTEKRVSYDFKLTDTDTGKELWGRLDTPIRSLLLKGNFTNSNRAQSGGIGIYWDASRNMEKRMAVGVEHTDLSSERHTSHRVQLKIEHPKLSRDITQTNILTFGPNEFQLKSDLVYSTQRQHHFQLEMKGNNLSQRNRDNHYKGEFMLRYPIAKLDVRANGEIMDSKLNSLLSVQLHSMDSKQVRRVREIKATVSKIDQTFDIMLKSDEDIRNILGTFTDRNGEIVVFIEAKKNEVKDLTTLLKVNYRNRNLELSVVNAENTGVHAAASFPKESATIKLSHTKNGNDINDVNVYVGLEQSKILKSQMKWRPKMWEELRITTGENLRAFIRSVKEAYSSTSQSMSDELGDRVSLMSRLVHEQLTPFTNEISNDFNAMKNDLNQIKSAFNRMYRNNEFYMQDIVRTYKNTVRTLSEVMEGLALGFEVLGNIIIEYTEEFYYTAYYGYLDLCEYLGHRYVKALQSLSESLVRMQETLKRSAQVSAEKLQDGLIFLSIKIRSFFEQSAARLDKIVRDYAPFMIDGYFYVKNAADKIRYSVNNMYECVYKCIGSNKYYIALKGYASSIAETIRIFKDYEYAESAQAFINRIYDAELLNNVLNHPQVEYMSGLVNDAVRKSVQIYYNSGLDMVVASLSETVVNYAKEKVLNAAQDLLSDMYQLRGGAKYEFAPHRGYMAFEMNLPGPRDSLIEVFDFQSYPEYKKMMNLKNAVSTELYEDFCFWDYYYRVKKYLNPEYWLLTFTGHAMIAGNQHYITFDKLPFDYAGQCSYLLARDFVDGNFSVVVNYGSDHKRKSLTVLTDGKKIDIGHDYKITIDDTRVESPIQTGQTVVMREGSNIRIENDKKGLYVVCNFIHNYCSVSLSGFYYGKTGGLFGTFNYEPKLDLMTPTRHLAEDIDSFASSWEVGQAACRSTENMATVPSNSYRVHEKCKSLFSKSSSEFRACFKQVDPEPYLRMCITDLSAVRERNFDEAICEAAAAYFLQCKVEGIPLKMPSKCVRCEKQDGTMMIEGEALKFTRDDAITAADVVFLIEEKQCNKDRVSYLTKLAQSIEENYRQHGYRDVRFSVVGFGGNDIHSAPHVHTMDGQISGHLRSLQSALESLEFGNGPVNILEALRYAASLNFRPGTTKSFVLMKCSTCKSEEVKAEYGEMLRTLIDGDISLHLLMDQTYEMKVANKNTKGRKVFGVDKVLAYTLKDVKDPQLSGDGDLMAQLRIPKDVCIPLAFEVNGSSFDVQYLTDTKKSTNKKFMDVVARRVVKSAQRTTSEWGMCCECIATVDGVGRTTCQRCVSEEIANMISADTSGINMIIQPEQETSKTKKHKDKRTKH